MMSTMKSALPAAKSLKKYVTIILITAFILQPLAVIANQTEEVYQKWEEISSLRRLGQFDRAIEVLRDVITQYSMSNEVLRYAYNQLVWTYFSKGDMEGATEAAREALKRFPDLEADTTTMSGDVNVTYSGLRSVMFGSVTIAQPESCRVFLNDTFKGITPLQLEYVEAGPYHLVITKSGYHDYAEDIVVDPNGKHSFDLSMDRQKTKGWWFIRVAPAVLAGALLAVGLGMNTGGSEPAPEPLPPPPPPPTRPQ